MGIACCSFDKNGNAFENMRIHLCVITSSEVLQMAPSNWIIVVAVAAAAVIIIIHYIEKTAYSLSNVV